MYRSRPLESPFRGLVPLLTALWLAAAVHGQVAVDNADTVTLADAEFAAALQANEGGDWQAAVDHWSRALELYRKQPEATKRQAVCLMGLAMAHRSLERHAPAVEALTEAIELFSRLPDTERHRAACLFFLGQSSSELGDFGRAIDALQRGADLYAEIPQAEHSRAETLYYLALACGELGRYERQIEALTLALSLYGEDETTRRARADCLKQLGPAEGHLGRFRREIEVVLQALELYELVAGTEADRADCLLNLGAAYGYLGDHHRKIEITNQALEMYRKLPDTEMEQGLCLQNLGVAYGYLGEHQRCIQLCHEAFALLQKRPDTSAQQALCLRTLGTAYADVGQDEQFIAYTVQALELYRTLPYTERDQAACLNNLGIAYGRLGQHEARIRVTQQALDLYRGLEGTEADQAGCLQNLANAHSFLGDTARMVQLTGEALSLYEKLQGTEADRADCHINLGVAYRDSGDLGQSAECFLKAEGIYRAMARGVEEGEARWLPSAMYAVEAGLGKTLWKQGDLYAAYRYFARSTIIIEHLRGRAATTLDLKTSFFAQMAWVYDDIVGVLHELDRQGLSVGEARLEEAEPEFWQDLGLEVPRLWRDWQSFREAMIHYSEGARARALRDMLANEPLAVADDGTRELWAQLNDLVRQERRLQADLAAAAGAPDEQTRALWQRYQEVFARRQEVEMAFCTTGLGQLAEAPQSRLADWQGLIGPSQALLQYRVLPERALLWVITAKGIAGYELPVTEGIAAPDAEALVAQWMGRTDEAEACAQLGLMGLVGLAREPMQALADRKLPTLPPDEHLRVLAVLHDLLIGPAAGELRAQGVRHLIIVPDGPLYYLPFVALVSDLPEDISDIPGGYSYAHLKLRYALDDWDISSLPSLNMHLAMLKLAGQRGAPGRGLCAFGDPVFSGNDPRLKGADTALEAARLLWHSGVSPAGAMAALAGLQSARGSAGRGDVATLQRLPFSYLEMEYALAAFGADVKRDIRATPKAMDTWAPNQGFCGLAADEARILDPRLADYGEVLISTHGVIDLQRPMYSYLALTSAEALRAAGVDLPADDARTDGSLSLPELFGLRMNARVVTLSACRTGLGAYSAGEGMMGLSLGMFYAGARAMTVSLWSVDDARTAKLIARDHALLSQGAQPMEALLTAQREMLGLGRQAAGNAGDEPIMPQPNNPTDPFVCLEPYYWGAFQLVGQW